MKKANILFVLIMVACSQSLDDYHSDIQLCKLALIEFGTDLY
jgi:hypothetical protein